MRAKPSAAATEQQEEDEEEEEEEEAEEECCAPTTPPTKKRRFFKKKPENDAIDFGWIGLPPATFGFEDTCPRNFYELQRVARYTIASWCKRW